MSHPPTEGRASIEEPVISTNASWLRVMGLEWIGDDSESAQWRNVRAEAAEARCAEQAARIAALSKLAEKWRNRAEHGYDPEEPGATVNFWYGVRRVCDDIDAALALPPAPSVSGANERKEPRHVCGLEGYNGMIDPPCPACEARVSGAAPETKG